MVVPGQKEGHHADQNAEVEPHRTSAIEAGYQHFRLDKQGNPVSPKTLLHYKWTIRPFLRWLEEEHQEVRRVEQLGVGMVRQYRAMQEILATRDTVQTIVQPDPGSNRATAGVRPPGHQASIRNRRPA